MNNQNPANIVNNVSGKHNVNPKIFSFSLIRRFCRYEGVENHWLRNEKKRNRLRKPKVK